MSGSSGRLTFLFNLYSAFHANSKVLWDMVEVPDMDTIRATLREDSSVPWTKRFVLVHSFLLLFVFRSVFVVDCAYHALLLVMESLGTQFCVFSIGLLHTAF